MASGGHEYTLVGFSEEVDRRALVFVEPLPSAKVCSACGIVSKVLGLLPCEHFFCTQCCEQCERSGQISCPLDGDTCSDEEVVWMNHPARSVLAKQVLCWNHPNGCNVITAAADISQHFLHDCTHHLIKCPKCGEKLLAGNVFTHHESRCDASSNPTAAAIQPPRTASQEQESASAKCSEISHGFQREYKTLSMTLCSMQGELEGMHRTLKNIVAATTSHPGETSEVNSETRTIQESLSQMRIQTTKLKYQLDEILQNVYANKQTFHNSFAEKNEILKHSLTDVFKSTMGELVSQFAAFREAIGDGQRTTKAEFDRIALAIDRQYDRMSELLRSTNGSQETQTPNFRDAAEAHTDSLEENVSNIAWAKNSTAQDRQNALALLPSITPAPTTHTWTFQDYESLTRREHIGNYVARMAEPVYMCGYCVSFGIYYPSPTSMHLLFQLHQGKLDRYLEWPFNLQIKWSFLHPGGDEKLEYCMTPSGTPVCKYLLARPKGASTRRFAANSITFTSELLESAGFIKDGRMSLRLSLEDPNAD